MSTHLEKRLEDDLVAIRNLVAQQAKDVEMAIKNSMEALHCRDHELAYLTVLRDHGINRAMREIDRACHRFIALYLPSAGSLRLLASILRVNLELERVGDYAVIIAREAIQISTIPAGMLRKELERLTELGGLMLAQASKAFAELNPEMARSTILIADQLEESLDAVYAELKGGKRESNSENFALFVIFTQLKRVTDQAKNICQETLFAATGEIRKSSRYNILFVDHCGQRLSRLAVAVARKHYAQGGDYFSAGRGDIADNDLLLAAFLRRQGFSADEIVTQEVASVTTHQLNEVEVIIALQGEVKDFFPQLPFHTSALTWRCTNLNDLYDEITLERAFREISSRLEPFMTMLHGDGAL